MSDTVYLIVLIVGVPALAIVCLLAAIARMGTLCSREEEATAHVDVAALEGDLTQYIASLNRGEAL
jgi:hypothetical protein